MIKRKSTFRITKRDLLALSWFMATKDVSTYLRGVFVEGNSVVATDGNALLAMEAPSSGLPPFIIPSKVVEKFASTGEGWVRVIKEGDRWIISDSEVSESFEPVEGNYPDFKRVIPPTVRRPDLSSHIDFPYHHKVHQVQELLGGNLGASYSGNQAAVFTLSNRPDLIMLVMPCKVPPASCYWLADDAIPF